MRGYTAVVKQPEALRAQPDRSVPLSPELIGEYLETLRDMGCAAETVKNYRMKLNRLYQYLPEDKRIRTGTLEAWRSALLEAGYSVSTVNGCTAAANGLMVHCGHRELSVEKTLKCRYGIQPELTRSEYLRLLSVARTLGKEREYLLIKVFGSTGLILRDLPRLTAEAVRAGKIRLSASILHIPDCLQKELLDYIRREGITHGAVFVTKAGTPMGRSNITGMIQGLCRDACVAEEKATPRCLKKLYQTTWSGILASVSLLAEQAHDCLLETEQLTIGWKQEAESE